MQERLFSRRCLYLTSRAAYWNCCRSVVWTDLYASSRYDLSLALQESGNFAYIHDTLHRPTNESHILPAYETLISKFTTRRLTYSSDTLNAFAGIVGIYQ